MKDYERVFKMEKIKEQQEETIEKLKIILNQLDLQQKDYEELMDYYYSEERNKDIENNMKGLIPGDFTRGVLTEDQIYNLAVDSNGVAIRMIETALKLLKT